MLFGRRNNCVRFRTSDETNTRPVHAWTLSKRGIMLSCPVAHGSPVDTDDDRFSLADETYTSDPHAALEQLREKYGALAPINLAEGVPATLVLGYRAAVRILFDPEHFPANPRQWEATVAEDCPLLPMLAWRPAARYTDGTEHAGLREVSRAAIDPVDLYAMHATVEDLATAIVNTWIEAGSADLASQYALPLVFAVLNNLIGCPTDIGKRVTAGMAARFDSTASAERGMNMLIDALSELVQHKRDQPGDDMTTRLIDHPLKLSDEKIVAQLASFYGAGIEATRNLILNAVYLLLTDDSFGGSVLGGNLSPRDAVDWVLFNNPPMVNFCITYPKQPVLVDNTWLPAHQPVVICILACNLDPDADGELSIAGPHTDPDAVDRTGNRSHLAFGTGNHACPARDVAYQLAVDALVYLLDLVPEIRLAKPAEELGLRPGPFQRALEALPVVFPRAKPILQAQRTRPRDSQPTRG
ncbi:cytochrome P450 [Nocardia sp. CA-107356]|uniref:cytochrome P450 n=1 Tax=Nocardia sp. CA-107356 TaxID=3239972 RepID=UPI003D8F8125